MGNAPNYLVFGSNYIAEKIRGVVATKIGFITVNFYDLVVPNFI